MGIPNKILWYLGYNNLGLILEQERKHWLLKTDKRKQVQDKTTGDIFEGEIDNRGSDVKIRSSKLPIKNDVIPTLSFVNEGANSILDFANAAFPFSMGCKGFMFARITSINYPMETNDDLQYKNYRIVFNGAVKRTLAFGVSPYSSEVYSGEWIETPTPPVLQMMDDVGDYSIEVPLTLANSTGSKFYYPLEEGLQPFNIDKVGANKYVSEDINDDAYIGYPLFWFSTDKTRTGPTVALGANGYNTANMAYMIFSTEGNAGTMYVGKAYVNVDGTDATGATPDLSLPSEWEIRCTPTGMETFDNSDADFNKNIDSSNIYFYKKSTGDTTNIPIDKGADENNVFRMIKNIGWTYVDNRTYKIDMNLFESNNKAQSGMASPLTGLFEISLDKSIPYYIEDKANLGYAGIEFTASNPMMDNGDRYPHDLDKWEGLPEWFGDPETGTPQHMAVYAIHNTPMYSELNPESRQVAALLLDPGKMKLTDSEELENDEIGRIYVISNDDPVYENNATSQHPKPERTIARICDIPTSVSDFLNVEGLVPVAIVDPKYVRTQAAYKTSEKEKLWNVLNSKVVIPKNLDEYGNPIYGPSNPNPYIFTSMENLNKVDLINNNDFREWINLNSMVDPTKVSVYSIANPGKDYTVNATGIVIIGGVAMNYIVTEVDEEGGVTGVQVVPQDSSVFINLSNFDMQEGADGITQKYGTTPVAGEHEGQPVPKVGSGLEIVMRIADYDDIRMKQGNIYDNLVAFVYVGNSLMMYRYTTDEHNPLHVGSWGRGLEITHFERTNTHKDGGGYSPTDAMTRFLIPYIKTLNVCSQTDGRGLDRLTAMTTPSFINITDVSHTPIHLAGDDPSTLSRVDLCGFHCEGFTSWIPMNNGSESKVMDYIKEHGNLDRDCYLAWQWNDGETAFRYGIIRRSMNNYVTTDTTTTIPPNTMKYSSYVNTNATTTVVWDVPEFGPMMWVYNPSYNRKEVYNINQDTRDLYISYSNEADSETPNIMSWKDIDIRISPYGGTVEKIINDKNKFNFYIYTNNPIQGSPIGSSAIYNEYEFVKIASQGDRLTASTPTPVGNWQLVFPRVNQYKIVSSGIQDGVYNTEVKLRRLVPIEGEDLGEISNVLDNTGHNINSKVVIFDKGVSGTKMKIYNKETGQFETV